MLVVCIVLKMLITTSLASKVSTVYKNTYGVKLNNIVKYLAAENSNSRSVGLRFLSANNDVNEPLTYNWMENRNYVDGYSYYEKILVDEKFDQKTTVGNIQGPLTVGAKVIIYCLAPKPFTRFSFNIIDQIYMTQPWSYYEIRYHAGFREGGWYAINSKMSGSWQIEYVHQTDESKIFNDMITVTVEVKPDHLQATFFDGVLVNVSQTEAPGDTPTCVIIQMDTLTDQLILRRLVYIKEN